MIPPVARRLFRAACLAATLLAGGACDSSTTKAVAVASVVLSSANVQLDVTQSQGTTISATITSADSRVLTDVAVEWTTSDAQVVTIEGSPGREVRIKPAGKTGVAAVVATAAGKSSVPIVVTVRAGAATKLALRTPPSTAATSGVPFAQQPVVEVQDALGNVVIAGTSSITAIRKVGTGTLRGTATVSAVDGVASFAAAGLNIAGDGAHTVQFTSGTLTPVESPVIAVAQSIATTQVVVPATPVSITFGTPLSVIVELRDVAGLPVVTSVPVTISKTSGPGVLGGTLTVNSANGVAVFSDLTFSLAGSMQLSAAVSGGPTATTPIITVNAATPSKLVLRTAPSAAATSGVVFTTQPVIEVQDALGNVVANNSATITVARKTGSGTLRGTVSATAVNGVATFADLNIAGVGAHTLEFISGALTPLTTPAVTVTQSINTLQFLQPAGPITVPVNGSFTVRVQLRDVAGLTLTTSGDIVTLSTSSGPAGGSLGGTLTAATMNGEATFANISFNLAGALQIGASAGGRSSISPLITVGSPSAAQLVVTSAPAVYAPSGQALGGAVVVEVRDAAGARVAADQDVVVRITAPSCTGTTLIGAPVQATSIAGLATFPGLVLIGPGVCTLAITATPKAGNPPIGAASVVVTVNGPPAQLGIAVQPNVGLNNEAFRIPPTIEIRDANNNLIPTAEGTVTVEIFSQPAGAPAVFIGTVSQSTFSGAATFPNLGLIGPPGDYQLRFVSGALTPVVSNTFPLLIGAAYAPMSTLTASPDSTPAVGQSRAITVQFRDAAGFITGTFPGITSIADLSLEAKVGAGAFAPVSVTFSFTGNNGEFTGTYTVPAGSSGQVIVLRPRFHGTPFTNTVSLIVP